jgi:hypothetical protein
MLPWLDELQHLAWVCLMVLFAVAMYVCQAMHLPSSLRLSAVVIFDDPCQYSILLQHCLSSNRYAYFTQMGTSGMQEMHAGHHIDRLYLWACTNAIAHVYFVLQ